MKSFLTLAIMPLALALVVGAGLWLHWPELIRAPSSPANPHDTNQVAIGQRIYAQHCASCHGLDLRGEPDWKSPKADGRMPAPPHDDSGHTWHHSDTLLFGIIRDGMDAHVLGRYESNMPPFKDALSDEEIWAVLAYIMNHWSAKARSYQREITSRHN